MAALQKDRLISHPNYLSFTSLSRSLLSLLLALSLAMSLTPNHTSWAAKNRSPPTQKTGPRPNIIFIVADDLGWNDVGYHNVEMKTPNIDQLAVTGIRLNQSYTQSVCSPSRTAFMTGVYPFRLGLQHMVILARQNACVPYDQVFLPQVLHDHGYRTHAIGKWHLGFCNWKCTPTYRGFDSFYGFFNGAEDYYSKQYVDGYDFRADTFVDPSAKGGYSTTQFSQRAESIITSHSSSHDNNNKENPNSNNTTDPFFIYLAFQSVHMPMEVPNEVKERDNYWKGRKERMERKGKYSNDANRKRRLLIDMATAMDDGIGRIVAALKRTGAYDNTIIVFTSDNGGWTTYGGNNWPLRGGKLSIFEGGTRVPAFVHSPLLGIHGEEYTGMIHAVDWFPTLVEAAGIPYLDKYQDGVSQWKPLNSLGASNRNEFIYNMDFHDFPVEGSAGIRIGDFKLIKGYPGFYQSWYHPQDKDQGPQLDMGVLLDVNANKSVTHIPGEHYRYLFNLEDDPIESTNLYHQLPEVVSKLESRLDEEMKRYVPPNFPDFDPESDPQLYGGVWSPGWC